MVVACQFILYGPEYALNEDGKANQSHLALTDGKTPLVAQEGARSNMNNSPYEVAISTNPLEIPQGLNSEQDGAHIGVLEQRQNPFNGAAPLIVPVEKALPTIIIKNGNNLPPIPPKEPPKKTYFGPNLYPRTGPTLITLPAQPSPAVPSLPFIGAKEEPNNTPAAETLLSQRPVRKSSLKRSFTIDEVEGYSSDDQESNQNKQKKKKVFPPPQECLPQGPPEEVIPCPLDTPWPRRLRSEFKAGPKTSKASVTRLKQAAHGTLPLGGSKNLPSALLGEGLEGGAGELDSNDIGNLSRGHNGTSKRQAQSGSKDASPDPSYQRHDHQQRQQNNIGPNPEQRKAMSEIAAAPPHLRTALLQQLLQEKLGMPRKAVSLLQKATSGNLSDMNGPLVESPSTPVLPSPSLSALPRSEQQQIVKQLLSRMTPQQRLTLLQSSIPHQANVIQQYYDDCVAPMQLQPQEPLERQPSHCLNPMVPLPAAVPTTVPTTATTTTPGDVLQRENSTTQSHPLPLNNTSTPSAVMGESLLRELLSELGESAEAQLLAMPREEQHKNILALIQRQIQKMQQQQQQQQQNIDGFGDGLPGKLTRHQITLQNRQGSLNVENTAMMNHSADGNHSMSLLASFAGQNEGFAVPTGGGGGGAGGRHERGIVDLDGMLASGVETGALEDGMNFLV